MKSRIILVLTGLVLVLAIVGCGSGDSSSSSTATEADGGGAETDTDASGGEAATDGGEASAGSSGETVYYISPVASQPGQKQVDLGVQKGAKELGWSEQVLDSALSPEKQVSNVEIAVNAGAAGLVSWTLDPNAVAGAYQKAGSKNIPVIGMNSSGAGVTATVWWENVRCEPGGPQAVSAEKIAEAHPGAKTIVIGLELAESTKAQGECFAKEAKRVGLDVVNTTNNEADTAAGSQKVFEPLLTKYPDVEAVWAYNDESALGVSAALLAGGKTIWTADNPDGVIAAGQNGDKGAVEAVEEERLSWTWDPDNVASGMAAVKAMKEALDGGKPGNLVVESKLVDSETVGEYVQPEERDYTLEDLPLKGS